MNTEIISVREFAHRQRKKGRIDKTYAGVYQKINDGRFQKEYPEVKIIREQTTLIRLEVVK